MITDEIIESINTMWLLCDNDEQRRGINAVSTMLGDFDIDEWMMNDKLRNLQWVRRYLPQQGGNQ